ncbi:MAG: putative Se/S carrier-like protein [Eubacteriales bacterium]
MKTCVATIPSINICISAKRALAEAGIFSNIVSIDPKVTRRGCTYGVEFACENEKEVRNVLRKARINYSQIINYDGGISI